MDSFLPTSLFQKYSIASTSIRDICINSSAIVNAIEYFALQINSLFVFLFIDRIESAVGSNQIARFQ